MGSGWALPDVQKLLLTYLGLGSGSLEQVSVQHVSGHCCSHLTFHRELFANSCS